MKKLLYIFTVVLLSGIIYSCQGDEVLQQDFIVPEGYMPVSFTFSAPDMLDVDTKGVDPDGKGVNSMILFCFDNFGMYISLVEVTSAQIDHLGGDYPYLKGKIANTLIPENTRRIHFVANQSMDSFDEDEFKGQSEDVVMKKLEGSSGMMIYWGYFAPDGIGVTDSEAFKEALTTAHGTAGNALRLLRNQARFNVNAGTSGFTVSGFTVVNTNAFGTVAPHHPTKGFKFSMKTQTVDEVEMWDVNCDWVKDNFITLPENTTRMTPPADVDIAPETCVFETDNNSAQPVSIIIKGKNNGAGNDLYYRVILMDNNGEFIDVRRNFNYTINIVGNLSYGQNTFEAALTAPATNNIWLSIDDDVKDVSDGNFALSVNETSVIVLAKKVDDEWELYKPTGQNYELKEKTDGTKGKKLMVGYTLADMKNTPTISNSDIPDVSWIEGSNISTSGIDNVFSIYTGGDTSVGEGEFEVDINKLDGLESASEIVGTVLIKKGVLQRKVKITVLKEMSMRPVWVSTQVNATAQSNVTVLFTVPESCPDELLPFDVYISVNHLDIRHTSDRTFPIITKLSDPENYGEDRYSHYTVTDGNYVPKDGETPIGYKYVYTVTEKGDQRIYFTNLIDRTDENAQEFITIESPLFSTVHKPFTFNLTGDNRIELPFINYIDADKNGTMGDDEVKYILVPQKINHKVEFDFALTYLDNNGTKTDTQTGNPNNEFLIYTENLSHVTGAHSCIWVFNEFNNGYSVTDNLTSGGRVMAFKFKEETAATPKGVRHIFPMYMYTTKAKNAEVIRISSNHPGSASAFSNDPSDKYNGNSFRSIIFELANYHPFHFNAKINGTGTSVYGNNQEATDAVAIAYNPATEVKLDLNICSFTGADGKKVDPFGYDFNVYIVAPMLKLPDSPTEGLSKITEGVYSYTVKKDSTNAKETLIFKKNDIVSDGEILITTDPELAGVKELPGHEHQIVNFFNKTFKISSEPIVGNISIKDGESVSYLKGDAFVSFALKRNNSRIGSMKISGNTEGNVKSTYSLTLRPEYNFSWEDDPIIITHTHVTGGETEVFTKEFDSLKKLYETSGEGEAIVLVKQNISTP
ncbi:MAG: hypothetical protein IKK19_02325 [Bacteroidales bacterium]|nr:hypothetical protein [Bacteroidales bacterium]